MCPCSKRANRQLAWQALPCTDRAYLMQIARSVKPLPPVPLPPVRRDPSSCPEREKKPAAPCAGPRNSPLFLISHKRISPSTHSERRRVRYGAVAQKEDDDWNDSQCRAGHLQLILIALLHAQAGDRDRQHQGGCCAGCQAFVSIRSASPRSCPISASPSPAPPTTLPINSNSASQLVNINRRSPPETVAARKSPGVVASKIVNCSSARQH